MEAMQVLRCFVVILSCNYIVFAQLNYDCEHAVPVQRDVQYVDDTALAIFSLSNLKYPTCGTSAGPVLFYSYVTQTDYFPLAISTCNGSAYNTYITVYTGSCLSLSCLASDDNSCENSPLRSTIRFEDTSALPAGTFLLIAVSGPAPTDLGQFTLKVTEGTLNDVCERRIPMENREIVQGNTISTLNTLASVGYPVCGSTSSQNTEVLFYEYVISMEPSSFMVSTCLGATNWDTYLSVYSHDNCSLMSCEDSNDDNCRFYRSTVILENYANGTQLLIAIHGYNNRYSESGPFSMVAQETPYNQSCDTSFEIIEGEISFGYISNNMATLADRGMISCIGSYYDSTPAAFFYYVTTKNFSPIMINVCGQFTDYENTQQVEVLTGDCNNLSCVATGVCWVALDPLYPAGTRLTIIVHDDYYYYYSRIFNIYVEEEPYPIGYDCENAMVLENQVPVFGNSTIAPNTFTTGSPAVFFHYTTQYDYSYIYISACRSLFPALVSTFSGPCHNLYNETGYDYGWMADCLQMFNHFYDDYYFRFGLPIGTELTIVVEGINSTDHGMFQLFVDERENTYPNKLSSCETAIPLSNNAVITGNNYDFNFLIELGYPECHGIPDFQNVSIVFYEYTTAYNFGTVVVSTCGSFYDTLLSVYTGPCGSLSCLAASDDACGDDAKAVITTLTKGTRILIGVQPYDRYQVGPFQLSVHEDLPITSNCSNAYRAYSGDLLDGETRNVSSTLNSYGYPSCGGTGMDSPSVLIKYQSTINFGNILFSLCNAGTTFDTVLHVYTHNSCGGVTCVATNNNACGLQSKIQLTEQYPANTQFLIAVHGTNPAQYGNFSLSIKENRPSPVNDVCSAAIVLSNMQTVSGYSESSISLASSLPSCGIQQHQSPVVFYKYTTQYPNGEIHIRTCNTANFDTVIRLYKGTCAALQCVKMEDDSPGCGTTTSLTLLAAEGVPVGTNLLIAVHGYNQAFGDFQLFFEEINLGRRPSNELCVTSIAASQGNTQGFTDGSLTGSASLPTCNGSGNQNSPVVFYHYTSSISFSTIRYSVCSATFTSRIAIYRGTCASLQCVPPVTSGTCEAVIKDNNLQFPAGTRFTIAVFGATTHSGNFTLNIQESAVCNPTGATITCPNNVTMTTDHSCNLGLQCATIPSGTANCVDLPTCSCTTAQVSGPEAGTEVVAGTYTRTYRATNNIGAVSTCSYNIQVSNECNPNGPTMSCNSGPYIFETSTSCFINNLPCYPLTSIPLGTCTDNFGSCDCEVYQVSGPVEGEQLTEGNYTIISEAKNKLNITSQSKCEIQIVVKNVFVPQEPSPQISTNVDPTQSRTKTQTPTRTPIPKSPTPTPTSAANANQQCQNCQTGNTQTMLGSNTTNNNNEETVVNLVTDSGQPVGSISVPPNLVQGTGSLSVSYVEAPRNGNARVGGVILDITLQDQFGGDITKLNSPLTICIEETGNSNQEDDLCLGYYDVDERSWICEDECLEQENNMYCGQTDHLTSFALLLGGNGGGSGDPCDSNAIDYAYAWASLAVVGFAIIVIIIVILAWELRFQHRNHQAKTVFRNQASKISQHM